MWNITIFKKLKLIFFPFFGILIFLFFFCSLWSLSSLPKQSLVVFKNKIVEKQEAKLSQQSSFLSKKMETFRLSITDIINKLGTIKITRIRVDGQDYLWTELLQDNNIGKWHDMPSQAREELKLLYENGITNEKLLNLYKSKLDPLLLTKRETFRQSIKETINYLKQIRITDIHVDKKSYSWVHLTNQPSPGKIIDINKKYVDMSFQAQAEFRLLYENGITKQKLFELYKRKTNSFLNIIKPTLQSIAKIKVTSIFNDGALSIGSLITNLNQDGSEQTGEAQKQLLWLYNHNFWESDLDDDSNASVFKDKLEAFLVSKRKAFKQSIKEIINDLAVIKISKIIGLDGQDYLWTEMTEVSNINKKYVDMSPSAQKELVHLHEGGINNEKLTKLYKDKLDFFLNTIKPALQFFAGARIFEFKFNKITYQIANLNVHLDRIGSAQTSGAKNELITLLLDEFTYSKLWEVYKDTYYINVRDELKELFLHKIIELNISETTYQVKHLTKNGPNFAATFSALLPLAQEELIKLATAKVTKTALFDAALDIYLKSIRPILKLFAEIKKTELKIIADQDNFIIGDLTATIEISAFLQSEKAKDVLIRLFESEDTDGGISPARLTTIYNDLLDTFLEKDKSTLQLFSALNIIEVAIGKKVYLIGNLNAHLDKTGAKQTGAAKNEFIKLLTDDINKEKLTASYSNKLDSFFITLISSLQEFLLAKITEVIIDGKSYSIDNLTASLWTDDATQVNDAQTELLSLLKYNLDSLVVKSKLDAFLTQARANFKQTIQHNLKTFVHAKINKAQIGDQVYSLKALINVNNINKAYANMTGLAQTEFTRLWAAKINSIQLTTALENNQMEKYYLQIYDFFNTFTSYGITQVQIKDKTYLLDKLLAASVLEQSIYLISSGSRVQLQTLFTDGVSTVLLIQTLVDTKRILAFQKNWDGGQVSSYLFWLSLFNIEKVKLSQNKVVSVDALAAAIQTMLSVEKFDFTKLQRKARKQLLDLLNSQGELREVETFQDDVWRQIKNHQKWKAIEGPLGKLVLQSIKTLLLEVQDLGISKISHPFFLEGYNLSFLQDNPNWKQISFENLLQGMKVVINSNYVEFHSHLFPRKKIFQIPLKKIPTIFSIMTISSIKKSLEEAIDTKLDSYKTDIQPSLKAYAQAKVNQFKIGEQVYQIDHLIELANLNLFISELPQDAKIQLKVLAMVPITAQQLDEILIKLLISKKQKPKSVQGFNFKPLIIGFTVVAALVVFSVVCTSFYYWFFKIKK